MLFGDSLMSISVVTSELSHGDPERNKAVDGYQREL